jgi:hypothetical protein
MPRGMSTEMFEVFVREQSAETLANVLLQLATDQVAVHERLVRLQLSNQPKALAATFRQTLTDWCRSTTYFGYAEVREFGNALETWLEQIEAELLPTDPAAALALAEEFVEANGVFFECADDSGGVIGDAVRAGCRLWLVAASRCKSPAELWPARIAALVAADEYGARDELLRRADLLLDERTLRELVSSYEQQLVDALAKRSGEPPGRKDHFDRQSSTASSALGLLAEALQDPDLVMRTLLRRSPLPNPHQKEGLVRSYLKYGRPDGALAWLDKPWGDMESSRQHLLAQVLPMVGRAEEARPIRQAIFKTTLSVTDLHAWLELVPAHEQGKAIEQARQLAQTHEDPVVVARLLMDLGDDRAAEAALVAAPARIPGSDYGALLPLVAQLENKERSMGATVVYRALLVAILDRAYAPAYPHAARYWGKLQQLAQTTAIATSIEAAESFEARIRLQHRRKVRFWSEVNGLRSSEADPASND